MVARAELGAWTRRRSGARSSADQEAKVVVEVSSLGIGAVADGRATAASSQIRVIVSPPKDLPAERLGLGIEIEVDLDLDGRSRRCRRHM